MRIIENIQYSIHGDYTLLDMYLPDCDEFPVFVYFHGGGLESYGRGWQEMNAEYLCSKNIGLISAEYRSYPHARYPEFIMDAAAAVAWVKNHINEYGKCENIFVGGSSAGGYLSMMLCFDPKYLAPYKIKPTDITGYIHDAGQPTTHFNVLRERGFIAEGLKERIVVDEAAPMYHVGTSEEYSPMLFIISDNDRGTRIEQTNLMIAQLKAFGHEDNVKLKLMHGTHCEYVYKGREEKLQSVFGPIIEEFIVEVLNK